MKYPSRVDSWLVVALTAAPTVPIVAGIYSLNASAISGMISIGSGIVAAVVIALLAWPCVYTLTDETLEIRCGLLRDTVSLRKVVKAEPSSSLWSAPALSLRRVKVTLDDGIRIISPRDRETFLADLATRARAARERR